MHELKKHPSRAEKISAGRAGFEPKSKPLKKRGAAKEAQPAVQEKGLTTSENLEERFDRGETVLDYFDVAGGAMRYPK